MISADAGSGSGPGSGTVTLTPVQDLIADAGEIDVDNGKITLNKFRPDTTAAIKITVIPNSLDLAPKRDQLLTIDDTRVTITPEIDTIAVSGSTGSINYTTTSRFK